MECHYALYDIKEDVQQVSDAIAAVINVDIIIYDERFNIIAATGGVARSQFWKEAGTNVCRAAVLNGRPLIIADSGSNPVCNGCKFSPSCPQKGEIAFPLVLEGKSIGVISLTAFSEDQQRILMERSHHLLNFLEKMEGLLVSRLLANGLFKRTNYLAEQLATLMNAVHEGIIAVNESCTIIEFNAAAERILGLSRESALGQPLEKVLPHSPLLEAMRTGQPFPEEEIRQKVKGRGFVPVVCSAKPLRQLGRIVGAIATLRDISEARMYVQKVTGDLRNYTFDDIIGRSLLIKQAKERALAVAKSDSSILITGETGTGKEIFARAIHAASDRAKGPFIGINCAAIPESLLESELFGYEGGAFTGALKGGKVGKFELASGGTLFLDEIGDMPIYLQVKLLRVLEEMCIERVGGTQTIPVDVRVTAATNKDLERMMEAGEFRKDLFYRLNVIPLHIPSLRERREDIDLLCEHFVRKYSVSAQKDIKGISPEVRKMFYEYPWPGNVRELANAIEYAVNMETGPVIAKDNLPPRLFSRCEVPVSPHRLVSLQEAEKQLIKEALRICSDDYDGKLKAAQMLGIHVATLYRKMKRYGLE